MKSEKYIFLMLTGLAAACATACGPAETSFQADSVGSEGPASAEFERGRGLRVVAETRAAMGLTYAAASPSQFVERTTVRARCLGRTGSGDELRLRAVIAPDRKPFAGSGMSVRTPSLDGDSVSARLVEIDDQLRAVDGNLELIAAVAASALPPGSDAVDLVYQTGPERESLGVLSGAVIHAAKGDFVYEDGGEFLRRRRVVVGTENAGRTEIRSGLPAGARVVVQGADQLWILELALVGGMGNLETVKEAN